MRAPSVFATTQKDLFNLSALPGLHGHYMAFFHVMGSSYLITGTASRTHDRREIDEDLALVFELFPRLKERLKQGGWSLSGGEQQMLAIGRALMSRPSLLMLDEPSLGLAPIIIEQVFDRIVELNKRTGLGVLLVEQNSAMALEIASRAFVLETGTITLSGPSPFLANDPRIREAYLGG